jgi:ubiquinone/menaquinone biosynthesis C-methylase UbiE
MTPGAPSPEGVGVRTVFGDAKRAADYAARRFPPARERRERRAFERLLKHLQDGPQLDAPCGAGRLGASLAAKGRVVALDGSAAMLVEARRRGGYAALVLGDAFALPFADAAFAGAACVRLLHHLRTDDRRRVLAELARVCRGPFVVSYYDAATFQAWKARKKRATKGSRKPIARAEFAADLAATGLAALASSRPLPLIAEQTLVAVGRA